MLPAAQSRDTHRLLQVDGLRALAALAVVAYHYTTRYQEVFPDAAPLLGRGFGWGHLGVNLFFAISGFVIVMTLERSRSAFEFASSRFARLYPAYWGAVALTTLVLLLLPLAGRAPEAAQVLANLTMLQRFFGIRDVDGAYWSLQIELIFYVWMLALWRLGALRQPVRLCIVWTAAVLVTKFTERHTGAAVQVDWSNALMLYWFPWFAIGVLSWDGLRTNGAEVRSNGTARLAALAFAIFTAAYGEGLSTLACALGSAALLHLASRRRIKPLAGRPLVFFGTISYPLYLLHQYIGWTVVRHLGDQTPAARALGIIVAFTVSVALAWLLHRLVEEPWRLRLRTRARDSRLFRAAANVSSL